MDDSKKEITLKVAGRIKYFRLLNGLSQESLALSAGVNTAYFGHIERGLKCPTIDTLNKIANALNISLSELLNFQEHTNTENAEAMEKIYYAVKTLTPGQAMKVASLVQEIADLTKK